MRLRRTATALLLLAACTKDLTLPAPGIPFLTVTSISPNPAKGGDAITVDYEVSADVLECQAIVGPLWATCAITPPSRCSCTAVVPDDITESIYAVNLSGRSAGGTGRAFEAVKVDQKAPKITGSRLTLLQRAGGWRLSGQPAAIVDAVAGVAAIRLHDSATGTRVLGTVTPQADGSVPPLDVAEDPPAELWLEAEDVVGHVARARVGRVLVEAGLGGRVRHAASPVQLRPYAFATEGAPTVEAPGYGAAVVGEIADASGAAVAGDGAALASTAAAATATASATMGERAIATPLDAPGPEYSTRRFANAAYDPLRRRVVLFGGYRSQNGCTGPCYPIYATDTWELDPDAGGGAGLWTQVAATGPAPRTGTGMTWDSDRGRIVLFGGARSDSSGTLRFNDAWEWDGAAATWIQLPAATPPTPRSSPRLAFDPARGRLLAHGGNDGSNNCDGGFATYCTGTWELAGGRWRMVTGTAPSPSRTSSGTAWSTRRGEVVLFGGFASATSSYYSDSWRFADEGWVGLEVGGFRPGVSGITHFPTTFDAARGAFQVSAGTTLFEYGESLFWSPPIPWFSGTTDAYSTAIAWDPVRQETLLVRPGGHDVYTPERQPHARTAAQTFALDLAEGATLEALAITWVGAGSGGAGAGATLHAWNWARRQWDPVGSHAAAEGDPVAARSVTAALPRPVGEYLVGKRLWIMASAPASDLAGSVESRITTDGVRVDATYTVP